MAVNYECGDTCAPTHMHYNYKYSEQEEYREYFTTLQNWTNLLNVTKTVFPIALEQLILQFTV